MYGLILENVASYIRTTYGANVWQEILYVAGLDETTFNVGETYSEGTNEQPNTLICSNVNVCMQDWYNV